MRLSSRNGTAAWRASTAKAPRWSAGAGTYRGLVNGEVVTGDAATRRGARRAAAREAKRRNRDDG